MVIGAIVHEILRYDALASEEAQSDAQISAIAWENGIRQRGDLQRALSEVKALLAQYRSSEVYRWLAQARAESRPLHTELPFMFRTEKRVIHGKIDVVFQGPGGEWIIIDYKTSQVTDGGFQQHAQSDFCCSLACMARRCARGLGSLICRGRSSTIFAGTAALSWRGRTARRSWTGWNRGSGEFQVYRSLSRGTEDFLNTENAEVSASKSCNMRYVAFQTPSPEPLPQQAREGEIS